VLDIFTIGFFGQDKAMDIHWMKAGAFPYAEEVKKDVEDWCQIISINRFPILV